MEGFLGILPEYCCWLVLLLTDPKKNTFVQYLGVWKHISGEYD